MEKATAAPLGQVEHMVQSAEVDGLDLSPLALGKRRARGAVDDFIDLPEYQGCSTRLQPKPGLINPAFGHPDVFLPVGCNPEPIQKPADPVRGRDGLFGAGQEEDL